jgi:hypothetical protein
MLVLKYCRRSDRFITYAVCGDPTSIRDLYWQLTHNYQAVDGTAIDNLSVSTPDGIDCTDSIISAPYKYCRRI